MRCAQAETQEPLEYNTFVNILWSETSSLGGIEEDRVRNFLEPIDICVRSDFALQRKMKGSSPLGGLKWPMCDNGVYVDIVLSQDRESISVGARTEGAGISNEKVKLLLLGSGTAAESILMLA